MTRRGYKEPWRWVRIAGYGIALVLGGAKGASLFGAIQGDEFSRFGACLRVPSCIRAGKRPAVISVPPRLVGSGPLREIPKIQIG